MKIKFVLLVASIRLWIDWVLPDAVRDIRRSWSDSDLVCLWVTLFGEADAGSVDLWLIGAGAGTLVRGGGIGLLFRLQISSESGEPTLVSVFSSLLLASKFLEACPDSSNDVLLSVVSFVRSWITFDNGSSTVSDRTGPYLA